MQNSCHANFLRSLLCGYSLTRLSRKSANCSASSTTTYPRALIFLSDAKYSSRHPNRKYCTKATSHVRSSHTLAVYPSGRGQQLSLNGSTSNSLHVHSRAHVAAPPSLELTLSRPSRLTLRRRGRARVVVGAAARLVVVGIVVRILGLRVGVRVDVGVVVGVDVAGGVGVVVGVVVGVGLRVGVGVGVGVGRISGLLRCCDALALLSANLVQLCSQRPDAEQCLAGAPRVLMRQWRPARERSQEHSYGRAG
eukprot:6172266-Pleurochrysis_carterae.AAC.2